MVIPIAKVTFDEEDLAMIQQPLQAGWVTQGRFVKEFETAFANWTGAGHAVATTSCTTALHLALTALGIGPGDEVIVPAFTWVATANCAEYMNARPRFVDIDPATYNIDPERVAECATDRTRAIIPVHLFGLSADMTPLLELAAQHSWRVVEDAACGFDARYKGRHVGTFGDAGCFSFHPRKVITTGEGGMVTTRDEALASLCRSYRDHGADRSDMERHQQPDSFELPAYKRLGFNYRMTDIQAALGVSQMRRADTIMASRRAAAARYGQLLAPLPWLRRPNPDADFLHGYQSYVCAFAPVVPTLSNWEELHRARNSLMRALEDEGIMTRPGTHAPPFLDYYQERYGHEPRDFPQAFLAQQTSIALPLYGTLSLEEQERVVSALSTAFTRIWRRAA